MLKILISNDDGAFAPGIEHLERAVSTFAKATVVAPDRNRSGASNSLTLDRPLRVREAQNGFLVVNGTPTDCVHIAVTGFLEEAPDMVVSGINWGANLGDDVIYSGTVAAAMEGRFLGYPAIAFSLASEVCNHFDTAEYVVKKIIKATVENPLSPDTILNVNIPDCPIENLRGFEVTRLGNRHKAEPLHRAKDPRGREVYWIGPAGKEQDSGIGTDFHAIRSKKVSITPLQIDLTRYRTIDSVAEWAKGLEL